MFINRYLIQFTRENEKLILKACVCELMLTILGTGISLCLAFLVRMLFGEKEILFFTNIYELFLLIGIGLLLRYILYQKKILEANRCSIAIKSRLRNALLEKLYDLGPAFTVSSRTGDIASTISDKVEGLSYYYMLYLPVAVSAFFNAACLLLILAWLDWFTAIVCLAALAGMAGCPMLFYRLMRKRGEKEWEAHSAYYADCLDSIQGMTALKAFNANGQRKLYIHEKGRELRLRVMEQLRITMLENGALEFLARFGIAFSVAAAAVHVTALGESTEKLIYIFFLVGACFTPMMNLTNAWHMGYRGVTASYSIVELLEQKAVLPLRAPRREKTGQVFPEEHSAIRFEDVCFAYNREEGNVLHNVSFTVPEKTMTALVGTSGSGKSTIAHLLAGFYPVQSGRISVGGLVMGEESVGMIQEMISAVWQDSHIFYGTVKENIRIGREDASDEDIIRAAKQANIHSFVMSLPKGYDTILGENGMRFSGGERQRIALARAFLKDAPILLFDEATSSLDRKNEIEIQKSFLKLRQGKTALVIAHRLATIQQADQICIVEGGRITACAAPEELWRTSAAYRALMGEQMAKDGEEERVWNGRKRESAMQ